MRDSSGTVVCFDCHGGASGDMLLGALLDAGADRGRVNDYLSRLGLGLHLRVERVQRAGLGALKATVMVGEMPADPDETAAAATGPGTQDHSHGPARHSHDHSHEHNHDHGPEHSHEHDNTHGSGHQHIASHPSAPAASGHGDHRGLADITRIIESAPGLPGQIQEDAVRVFRRLAEAEAHAHGSDLDQVHFHEVGAADSIGDIVGVCACLYDLGAKHVLFGRLPTGGGVIRSAHGELPVPAPATLYLLTGLNVWDPGVKHEMVTPTGAALLACLGTQVDRWPPMVMASSGTGAGSRDTPRANIVRVFVGTGPGPAASASTVTGPEWLREDVIVCETNLDDVSGQVVASACDALLQTGALDAWWTPCGMKKGRPGVVLSFLTRQEDLDQLLLVLFAQVPTLGIRFSQRSRAILERRHQTVETSYGPVRVKLGLIGDQVFVSTPEFEDCRKAAAAAGIPVRTVISAAAAAAEALGARSESAARPGLSWA